MLRVLVLTARFPDAIRPNLGIFVERQSLELAGRDGVEVRVVAPLQVLPFPLSRRRRDRWMGQLPRFEIWKGLRVYRPRCIRLPRLRRFDAVLQAAALLPLLRRVRAEFPFDAISAEFFWPDGPVACLVGRRLSVPFIVTGCGVDVLQPGRSPPLRRQMLAAAQAAGAVLAVSADLRDRMIALGVPAERIAVHYTGLDHALFRVRDREKAKARLGIKGPLLLTVGGLHALKGQRLAIEALGRIDGATLILAGGGPDRTALEAKARSLGLDGRVRFLGSVPHEQLPDLYSAADVFILPTSSEGLANVWVESLACGTPVVTGDAEGAREALSVPEAGRIVPLEPELIAAAVRSLLDSPPAPLSVAAAAANFSWARNGAELEAHLRGATRVR
jgi:teichuronic acid biosynthesis glycosyltransferase TuaC